MGAAAHVTAWTSMAWCNGEHGEKEIENEVHSCASIASQRKSGAYVGVALVVLVLACSREQESERRRIKWTYQEMETDRESGRWRKKIDRRT